MNKSCYMGAGPDPRDPNKDKESDKDDKQSNGN